MPALKRITVHGFKSIRALEDFELRGLNVLIGANGAGKSNFISLFRMLAELVEGRLQFYVHEEDGPDAGLSKLISGDLGVKHIEHVTAEIAS